MLGFLIAIAAGAATPKIEDIVARPVAKAVGGFIELDEKDLRVLAFLIALLIASLLGAMLSNGSGIGLMVGGTIGYFLLRLIAVGKRLAGK